MSDTIELSRRDLRLIFNAVDSAYPEIEAAVGDGDVKEEVLAELDDALVILNRLLK